MFLSAYDIECLQKAKAIILIRISAVIFQSLTLLPQQASVPPNLKKDLRDNMVQDYLLT